MTKKYSRTVGKVDWTQDEDLALAEMILRSLREGSSAARGIEEASKILNRTKEGTSFRWYSIVSKQYKAGIELARRQGKATKEAQANQASMNFNRDQFEIEEIAISDQKEIVFEAAPVETVVEISTNENNNTLSEVKLINEYLQNLINSYNKVVAENEVLRERVKELERSESHTQFDELAKLIRQTAQIIKR